MKTKGLQISFVLAVLCLVLFLLWPKGTHAEQANPQAQDPIIPVRASAVSIESIPQSVDTLGTLSAPEVVTISAQSDGRVSAIHFKNGQQVASGMPIVQMDNTQAQADYDSAMAAWNLAVTKYNRSKLLINEAISQQDLADLKADMESKHAAVQSAQASLNDKQITAPFSGVLGAFQVSVGDYAKAGSAIVSLVNTEQLRADYKLPENLKSQLQQGQLVEINSDAYPDKVFYGTVNYISPTVNQTTRTLAIEATINNKDGSLAPGMFVHVAQEVGKIDNAVMVPDNAVLADIKGYFVYKLVGDRAVQTYIQEGQHITGAIQVVTGLQKGDQVITEGQQKLEDGSIVKVLQ